MMTHKQMTLNLLDLLLLAFISKISNFQLSFFEKMASEILAPIVFGSSSRSFDMAVVAIKTCEENKNLIHSIDNE